MQSLHSYFHKLRVLALIVGLFAAYPGQVFCQNGTLQARLNPKTIKILVDSLSNQVNRYYVSKESAGKISAYLKKSCKEGAYNKITDPHVMAGRLTEDVSSVCKDEHFHVEYNPALANEVSGNIEDVPKMVAEKLEHEKARNFGFRKAEILSGNIGYLEITSFSRLNRYSRETAESVLKMLSNAGALIIDLRYGAGGSPEMVNFLVGHFFHKRVHVSNIYIRSENTTMSYWTTPDSAYYTLGEIPIYILTSYKTFSAAEGLAYQLQSFKRATIIGEVTRGGAHTVTYRPLSAGFVADIPFGKAMNPVTGENWEGKGIMPDIAVSADEALESAEMDFFSKALKDSSDKPKYQYYKWYREITSSVNHPFNADTLELKRLAGNYGPYAIMFDQGRLFYRKTGKAPFPLIAMSAVKFRPKGNDSFMVEFRSDEQGKMNLITYYDDGRVERASAN